MKRHSTSPPCGNFYRTIVITRRAGVFPMESNTKTMAKRARVEPRMWIVLSVSSMFQYNYMNLQYILDKKII